ncbi:unnamed protein product [Notodromas monacha]|uniref:Protein kinase domain-containing protein n=1 Tax=Notodromas monacha TaxID=399045 RepID=A0A7R9BTI6_9CRUS|nr:unnamed protein product [Notodromas monacha]CAG0919925.1 unnamed protein product [Notodromas monacha]
MLTSSRFPVRPRECWTTRPTFSWPWRRRSARWKVLDDSTDLFLAVAPAQCPPPYLCRFSEGLERGRRLGDTLYAALLMGKLADDRPEPTGSIKVAARRVPSVVERPNRRRVSSGSLTVLAQPGVGVSDGRVTTGPRELMLTDIHRVDYGTFGTIYRAFLLNGKKVAIKKVLQHANYRVSLLRVSSPPSHSSGNKGGILAIQTDFFLQNRELTILKELDHPNIVTLYYYFYTKGEEPGSDYLHLVMEFFNSNLTRLLKQHREKRTAIPMVQVKVNCKNFIALFRCLQCFMYQMFRGLYYLHYQNIGHRDIKPHNLLLDLQTCVLKVCDFGCAKHLNESETSISYICSRYYRPPELCMGATQYGVSIDMWSAGCVVAEMFLGEPIFRGSSREDQMVEIIKVLGTPNKEQMREMKVYEPPFRLPKMERVSWTKVFRHARTPPPREGLEVVNQILRYTPPHRLTASATLGHSFFAELRLPETRLPSGMTLPKLFNFTEDELTHDPALAELALVPAPTPPNNNRTGSSLALFRRLSHSASGTKSRRSTNK